MLVPDLLIKVQMYFVQALNIFMFYFVKAGIISDRQGRI
jgi:hypothetical protein